VRQDGHGDAATLVLVTHSAPDAALSATVTALRGMPAVRGVTSILRVEGLS
jgi:homoserine dehydrogenase